MVKVADSLPKFKYHQLKVICQLSKVISSMFKTQDKNTCRWKHLRTKSDAYSSTKFHIASQLVFCENLYMNKPGQLQEFLELSAFILTNQYSHPLSVIEYLLVVWALCIKDNTSTAICGYKMGWLLVKKETSSSLVSHPQHTLKCQWKGICKSYLALHPDNLASCL